MGICASKENFLTTAQSGPQSFLDKNALLGNYWPTARPHRGKGQTLLLKQSPVQSLALSHGQHEPEHEHEPVIYLVFSTIHKQAHLENAIDGRYKCKREWLLVCICGPAVD